MDRITEYLGEEAHTYLCGALKELVKTATVVCVAYQSQDRFDRNGNLVKAGHFDPDRRLLPVTPVIPKAGNGHCFKAIDIREWNEAVERFRAGWAAWKKQGARGREPGFEEFLDPSEPLYKTFKVENISRAIPMAAYPQDIPIVKYARKVQPTASWA